MATDNIVLIGMPGVGKSTLGVVLAKELGYEFVDADLLIMKQEKRLLKEIIQDEGVDGFLRIENQVNASIEAERTIIATGGSVIYGKEAMAHLKAIGTVIYLSLDYDTLDTRLGSIKGRGVVLKDGQDLRALYKERTPLYEQYADIIVDENGKDLEGTLKAVLASLEIVIIGGIMDKTEEFWDIYDKDKKVTGRTMKRNDWCLKDDEYHLTVLGVISRPDGKFLITKRAMDKAWAPGWWEVSGGAAMAGEDSYTAVCREVLEETGLDVKAAKGGYAFTYHRENPGKGDNYFVDVYRFELDFDESLVHAQEEETDGFVIASLDDIRAIAEKGEFLHYDSIKEIFTKDWEKFL